MAALLEEIFTGRRARPLPNCVADALETLANHPPIVAAGEAAQRA